jgi:hypothetical protein
MPLGGFSKLTENEAIEANAGFLFTKSTDWKYEREMRLLAMPYKANKILRPDSQPPVFLYDFPIEAVRQVILGNRI